jgi:SOS-response transcriptional repressor LexA
MTNQLTPKQSKVLQSIRGFIIENNISPTFVELRKILEKKGLKLKSNNSLIQYLKKLEEEGYIERTKEKRGVKLIKKTISTTFAIPIFGRANCSEALSYTDDTIVEDYIQISKQYLKGDPNSYFFIKAVGDSLNDSKLKIQDGDLVLCKKEEELQNNDIGVFIINGLATLKIFRERENENDPIVLMPKSTNTAYQPIILHPGDDVITPGKAVATFNFKLINENN